MSITAKDGAREPRIATATATILVQVNYLHRQIGIAVTARDGAREPRISTATILVQVNYLYIDS